jgi:RNA-binding protein 39
MDKSSVAGALALSGKPLMGQMLQVQPTYAEKNKTVTTTTTITTFAPSRLYVGSLNLNVTEDDIKQVFKKFGDIEFVTLNLDPLTGKSKGFAFVQYVL